MKLDLDWIRLVNFQGHRDLLINVKQHTFIFGANEVGKSTIVRAWLWLLTGKNEYGDEKFSIKPLDENNQVHERLDYSVEARIRIDGHALNIKRLLNEKWVRPKGQQHEEMKGHTTTYFWDDAPLETERSFNENIAKIGKPALLKLLMNVGAFQAMDWQDRRATLVSMAGEINDLELLYELTGITANQRARLQDAIERGKNVDSFKTYKAEIAAKTKKIADSLAILPHTIKEAKRAIVEPENFSKENIERDIKVQQSLISGLDKQLLDKSEAEKEKNNVKLTKVKRQLALDSETATVINDIKKTVIDARTTREVEITEKRNRLKVLAVEVAAFEKDITRLKDGLKKAAEARQALRDRFVTEDAKELPAFDDTDCKCPTCLRTFDGVDIEEKKKEFLQNFNEEKTKKLHEINNEGQNIKRDAEKDETELKDIEAKLSVKNLAIVSLNETVKVLTEADIEARANEENQIAKDTIASKRLKEIDAELKEIKEFLDKPEDEDKEKSDILSRKQIASNKVASLQSELRDEESRERQRKRVLELENQEKLEAQEVAELEAQTFAVNQLIKIKMEEISARVNGKFKIVKFKMFNQLVNGGEEPTCVTLINGVPYSDANLASKINASLDIINALSEHSGVITPIFIDNRESVTNIIETKGQTISLVVSPDDKKLRIEHK